MSAPVRRCHVCGQSDDGKHNPLFIACDCLDPKNLVHSKCFARIVQQGGVSPGERCPKCKRLFILEDPRVPQPVPAVPEYRRRPLESPSDMQRVGNCLGDFLYIIIYALAHSGPI